MTRMWARLYQCRANELDVRRLHPSVHDLFRQLIAWEQETNLDETKSQTFVSSATLFIYFENLMSDKSRVEVVLGITK